MRDFITSLPVENSHYSLKTSNKKFLSPDFESIKNIYEVFIDIYPELKNLASYQKFVKVFNEYDISIRPLKIDVCSTCDDYNSQIRAFTPSKNSAQINSLKTLKNLHLKEAEKFYQKLKELKSELKFDKTQAILTIDYQKNVPLPDTKRNIEYYLRKISIKNFCIYDEKSLKATMFTYSEHFAMKGANEVISAIDFYLKNYLSSEIKILHLFCDNCFGQNKNKFLWTFFQTLIHKNFLKEVIIYYPIPGHSRLSCDRAFALIERKLKTHEKIYSLNQYINLVKKSNNKNPFRIVYLNYPLTDNLKIDENPIAKVYNYKKCFENYLKSQLEYCAEVRIIKFKEINCEISLSLSEPKFLLMNLFKKNFNKELLAEKIKSIVLAYDKMLPITREKLYDVNKLIESLHLPENITFYQSLYSSESASDISNSKKKLYSHMKLNLK